MKRTIRVVRWVCALAGVVAVGAAAAQLSAGEWTAALGTTMAAVTFALVGFVIAPELDSNQHRIDELRKRRDRMEGKK